LTPIETADKNLKQWAEQALTKEALEPMLQFFGYAHLPEKMQAISRPFGELAQSLVDTLPRNPERTGALRKLLEAKDCAVRAMIYRADG
jgi:ferritin-like protein